MLIKICDKRPDSKSILDSLNGLEPFDDLVNKDRSVFFHEIKQDIDLPSSDKIELNDELILRENNINQIDEAFKSQRILILTGFGKKILAQQYVNCTNKKLEKQFSPYYTKETIEKFMQLEKDHPEDLDRALKKDSKKKFLFILEAAHNDLILKISEKHQNVFFIIVAKADDVSILKGIKTIDLPDLTREESKNAIKNRLKSIFKLEDENFDDLTFEHFDNELDKLLDHYEKHLNNFSYLKSSKIIIEYLENNRTDELCEIIDKMFGELMLLVAI